MRSCHICDRNEVSDQLRAWERVHLDEEWRLTLAFDASLPGWLVLVPQRHLRGLQQLTEHEAEGLGRLLRSVSAALADVTGCERTYVMLFAEAEGFSHLHFHIVPRHRNLPPEHRGPAVYALLGVPQAEQVSEVDRDVLAAQLHAALHQ